VANWAAYDIALRQCGPLWRVIVTLRSRTEGRQTTDVAIAIASLNRMLELVRPEYVRLP
jgi:hypothetical protein